MSKTDAINVANPAGSSDKTLGDDCIRALARAVIEILQKDHYTGASSPYSEDAAGEHAKVTLRQTTKPASVADKGFLYTKDVSGTTELFYEDEAGNEKQLTTAGKLNIVDADGVVVKTGAQTIAGVKTFSDIPVFASGINCNSFKAINVLDPTAAQDAVTKNYLEAKIGTGAMSPIPYAGEESITLPNGLIIKMGYIATTGNVTVTFGVAFPTALVSVNLTMKRSGDTTQTPIITAASVSAFTVTLGDTAATGYYWMAIGR
jgi:hypothetical protein